MVKYLEVPIVTAVLTCDLRARLFAPVISVQMFWSASSCETGAGAALVGDDDGILLLDSSLAPWFVFDSPVSGSTVHVCYQFNG